MSFEINLDKSWRGQLDLPEGSIFYHKADEDQSNFYCTIANLLPAEDGIYFVAGIIANSRSDNSEASKDDAFLYLFLLATKSGENVEVDTLAQRVHHTNGQGVTLSGDKKEIAFLAAGEEPFNITVRKSEKM